MLEIKYRGLNVGDQMTGSLVGCITLVDCFKILSVFSMQCIVHATATWLPWAHCVHCSMGCMMTQGYNCSGHCLFLALVVIATCINTCFFYLK